MFIFFVFIFAFLHSIKEGIELNFRATRFSDRNVNFWNPTFSISNANKVFGILIDARTLLKIAMLIVTMIALVAVQYKWFQIPGLNFFWRVVVVAVCYVAAYNISSKYYVFNIKKW